MGGCLETYHGLLGAFRKAALVSQELPCTRFVVPLIQAAGFPSHLTGGTGFPTGVVEIFWPSAYVILHWNAVWYCRGVGTGEHGHACSEHAPSGPCRRRCCGSTTTSTCAHDQPDAQPDARAAHMHLPLGHGGMSAGTSKTVSRCHTHSCCTENTTKSSGRTSLALLAYAMESAQPARSACPDVCRSARRRPPEGTENERNGRTAHGAAAPVRHVVLHGLVLRALHGACAQLSVHARRRVARNTHRPAKMRRASGRAS